MLPSWMSAAAPHDRQDDVGIFSFLKKKPEPAATPAAPPRADGGARPSPEAEREAERARQRDIARATAAKIDAIELAMTTDFFDDAEARWGHTRRAPAAASAAAPDDQPGETELVTLADQPDAAAAPASAPVVEESAILYANGQGALAEQMLHDCLRELGRTERQPWWMLFDLYQAEGREQDFDSIAIDYASHFETSPPAYVDRSPPAAAQGASQGSYSGVAPAVRLTGILDADAGPRLHALGASDGGPVRIDVAGVSGATGAGCATLLAALQSLRVAKREIVLVGADTLLALLRPMLAIGERSGGDAPWLLLLELLQLSGREKDFEETAMDYCVTFEVSPPSFETLPEDGGTPTAGNNSMPSDQRFLLPAVVDGDIGDLLGAIAAYAANDPAAPVVLDCTRLVRIGFGAASQLHTTLHRLAADKRRIELRELNHLVAALLRLLNYGDCARLYAHKY